MNLTEFLHELGETRNGWTVIGSIRKEKPRGDSYCPITAVCMKVKGMSYSMMMYPKAAEKLGLRTTTAHRIANAADYASYDPRLRARLLKAVGLK